MWFLTFLLGMLLGKRSDPPPASVAPQVQPIYQVVPPARQARSGWLFWLPLGLACVLLGALIMSLYDRSVLANNQVTQIRAEQSPRASTSPTKQAVIEVNGSVRVARVVAPQDGWVVLYRVGTDGTPLYDEVLGKQQVRAGENTALTVPLDVPVEENEQVAAVLHADTGAQDVFEYPNGADTPVTANGTPVVVIFSRQNGALAATSSTPTAPLVASLDVVPIPSVSAGIPVAQGTTPVTGTQTPQQFGTPAVVDGGYPPPLEATVPPGDTSPFVPTMQPTDDPSFGQDDGVATGTPTPIEEGYPAPDDAGTAPTDSAGVAGVTAPTVTTTATPAGTAASATTTPMLGTTPTGTTTRTPTVGTGTPTTRTPTLSTDTTTPTTVTGTPIMGTPTAGTGTPTTTSTPTFGGAIPTLTATQTGVQPTSTTTSPTPTGTQPTPTTSVPARQLPTIVARNQPIVNGTVVLERVVAPQDGWLVLDKIDAQTQPTFNGTAGLLYIKAGSYQNLQVPVARPFRPGDQVVVQLHEDLGMDRTFGYPDGPDKPVELNGDTVTATFVVQDTPEQLPDTGVVSTVAVWGVVALVLLSSGALLRRWHH